MIHFAVYLDNYNWRIGVYIMESCSDGNEIIDELSDYGCHGIDLADAAEEMNRCGSNIGITFTNEKRRNTAMVVGMQDDEAEFVNTMRHEQHHVVSHICQSCGIDMNGEEAAYMSGDIGQAMYEYLVKFGII